MKKTLAWHSAPFKRARARQIPTIPGVYVIKEVGRVLGLPVAHRIVYVGKSLNLRRRFNEHCDPYSEHNQKLLVETWASELEFWFAPAPGEEIDGLEQTLIRELSPSANVITYGGKRNDEQQ